jgi:hypothetical protein
MTSILLGPLASTQNNNTSKLSKSQGINLVYDTNISGAVKNSSGYLKQFEELRFDSISDPVDINSAYVSSTGINTSLQRNLDFVNGYSNFSKDQMHYGIVSNSEFTHGNMTPNSKRRDNTYSLDQTSQRKLETFTGIDSNYQSKKEKVPLFEPTPHLTWVNGMPVVADQLTTRYLPSNKNNYGNLPFETNVRVKPGLGSENREGSHTVYRINPKNVDALRSEHNQKISYKSKPLETIKKGEMRASNPVLSKYKLPDFKVTNFGDLVPGRAGIEAPASTGDFTNMATQRDEMEHYTQGPAFNSTMHNGPDASKTKFESAKRTTYYSDPTHAVTAVTDRPVMTNTQSFTNYFTQRASVNTEYTGAPNNANKSTYTIDYNLVPLTTMRELMIQGDNSTQIQPQTKSNYIFSNQMVLPTTHREGTSHNLVTNARANETAGRVELTDQAKPTIKENTSHNLVTNLRANETAGRVELTDQAKPTIKENTSHNLVTNLRANETAGRVELTDQAKPTIKENTSHNRITNLRANETAGRVELTDQAKPTIKENTSHNRITNLRANEIAGHVELTDQAKPTIKENTSHNRITNLRGNETAGRVELTDQAKPTIKENTSHNRITNLRANETAGHVELTDQAKPTIKENTSHNLVTNLRGNETVGRVELTDQARPTIKENTSHNLVTNLRANEATGRVELTDQAKPTIKQNTSHNRITNIRGNETTGRVELTDQAKPTIKQTTLWTTPEVNIKGAISAIYSNYQTPANPTTRQTTILNPRPEGNLSNGNGTATYSINPHSTAKPTIKQTTEQNSWIGSAGAMGESGPYVRDLEFEAKPTIKQTTEQNSWIGSAGVMGESGPYVRDLEFEAKPTVKQTTEQNSWVGSAGAMNESGPYVRDIEFEARPTIKHSTIYSSNGHINNSAMGSYTLDANNVARPTLKQTTMIEDYTGGLQGSVSKPISHQSTNNMETDDRREISTFNRAPNGKGDDYGPYLNESAVRMNERKPLYNYVGHPHKPLDMSAKVSSNSSQPIKPIVSTSGYYINSNFINTLKTNPYVNDIYHQSNQIN